VLTDKRSSAIGQECNAHGNEEKFSECGIWNASSYQ